MLANPAMLAGAAGLMAQISMQQQMDEITDYLATIDQKLDAVVRAQTNHVLARMDGVDLTIREPSVRGHLVEGAELVRDDPRTQGYALRQLGDLAEKIEQNAKVGDLAETAKEQRRRFSSVWPSGPLLPTV